MDANAEQSRRTVLGGMAAGAGLIAMIVAISVYALSSNYMLGQRERSAERQAATHAVFVRHSLNAPYASAEQLLSAIETPVDTYLLLRQGGQWFSNTPGVGPTGLPTAIRDDTLASNPNSPA